MRVETYDQIYDEKSRSLDRRHNNGRNLVKNASADVNEAYNVKNQSTLDVRKKVYKEDTTSIDVTIDIEQRRDTNVNESYNSIREDPFTPRSQASRDNEFKEIIE